jgi:hypothetical protein
LNNKEKSVKQYEPVAKATERILTFEEKKLLREDVVFMDDESDLGDVPFVILHVQAIFANLRDRIGEAVKEGEEEETIATTIEPLPSTPAQRLALEMVDLAVVDVDAIEWPLPKTKEQRGYKITETLSEQVSSLTVSKEHTCQAKGTMRLVSPMKMRTKSRSRKVEQ